jgi:protein phosphatase
MNQNATHWEHRLEYAALSDVGLRRDKNQDSLAVEMADRQEVWRQKGHMFVVADGMGAHAAGEVASKLAVDRVPLTYRKLRDCSPPEALQEALRDINARIFIQGQANRDFRGMGTTVSVLVLLPQGALIGHVGDSRIYRLRGNRLKQLTFDHSVVWEICAAEGISVSDIPSYIPRNVITRSVGPEAEVEVDLEGFFAIEPGDAFLLCTDGLSGQVSDEQLGAVLRCLPPNEAVRVLIDLANFWDGPDNITAIVARVAAPPGSEGDAGSGTGSRMGASFRAHPLLWTLSGAFVLLGAALTAGMGYEVPALAGLGSALVVMMTMVCLAGRGKKTPAPPDDVSELGRGPYTACDCTPNAETAETFGEVVQQLRMNAVNRNWHGDWARFNACDERAAAAAEAGKYDEVIREHCHAISFMMDQLKNHDAKAPSCESEA